MINGACTFSKRYLDDHLAGIKQSYTSGVTVKKIMTYNKFNHIPREMFSYKYLVDKINFLLDRSLHDTSNLTL